MISLALKIKYVLAILLFVVSVSAEDVKVHIRFYNFSSGPRYFAHAEVGGVRYIGSGTSKEDALRDLQDSLKKKIPVENVAPIQSETTIKLPK